MGPEEAVLTSSLCFQGRTVTPALPGENAALAGDGDSRAGLLGVELRCSLRGIRAGNVKPALPKAFLTTEPGPLLASGAFPWIRAPGSTAAPGGRLRVDVQPSRPLRPQQGPLCALT